ncbi:MBL fold metallo-hydrolase [Candidatus Bathyarchaeota archaeon]|nr:MBL fold metallo-hydrolase [Candidatus Bathyarchaeota archaeon]
MEIRFLGGTETVGKSGVLVKAGGASILLDYGVAINHIPSFPMHVAPKDVDAIVVTHAHLDHSGAIPLLHVSSHIPVYGLAVTFELLELLVKDFLRLSGYYLPYEYLDLKTTLSLSHPVSYGQEVKIKDATIRFISSGHIPGSTQVLISDGKRSLLYTSDINDTDTALLKAAEPIQDPIDAIIIESTYAEEDHPERRKLEASFIESVYKVVGNGGTVLVPAFGVGRSQEILCILAKYNFEFPVTVDGMAVSANEILMRHPSMLRDPDLFKRSIGMADWVSGWKERKRVLKKAGIIVAPAGMLRGGLAVYYAERLAKVKQNAIFLVSYQIPWKPGSELLEHKRFIINGKAKKVEALVERFDFSSHIGSSGLRRLLKGLKGASDPIKVFTVHGERRSCQGLARWASENGFEALAPKVGDTFEI